MSPLGQLAIKAAVSGLVIAAASELARRNAALGAVIASLPLTTLLALAWLWRDDPDPARAASFIGGTAFYVAGALPAFALLSLLLSRGVHMTAALLAACVLAFAGYLIAGWIAGRIGLI